jgi:hypothetical protein
MFETVRADVFPVIKSLDSSGHDDPITRAGQAATRL